MKLQARIHMLEQVINYLPGHVYWKDINGIHLGCNINNAKAAGLDSPEDIVGKTDYELSWKDRADAITASDKKVIETKREVTTEDVIILPGDKFESTFFTRKIPLFNSNREVIGIEGISQNITELKNTQRKLEDALKEAKVAERAKDCIVENMRHDWLTPFCGVCVLPEELAEDEPDPERKEMLQVVADSSKTLVDHVTSILEMISAADGRPPVLCEPIEVQSFVNEISSMYMALAKNKNITFQLDVDNKNTPYKILSDKYRLERILINLLSNAFKFTSHNGTISFKSRVNRATDPNDSMTHILYFSIQDTGIGMTKEQVQRVYEPFYRGTQAFEAKYQGAGTGLSAVKLYLNGLNGEISCQSEQEKGTCFEIAIPVRRSLIE